MGKSDSLGNSWNLNHLNYYLTLVLELLKDEGSAGAVFAGAYKMRAPGHRTEEKVKRQILTRRRFGFPK